MSNSLQPQGLYIPWNSPDQNTGVDSLSLLQGVFPAQGSNPGLPYCRWILYQLSYQGSPKVKVKVAQSCLTLCNPMYYTSPWNSPGQNTEVGSPSLFQGILPTQGSNPGLPYCRSILYQLSHQGSPHGCKQSFYLFSPCHIASCISQTLLQLGRHV